VTRSGPGNELSHINAAVCGFAVIDPALRFPQALPQLSLRKAGLLPQGAQERREEAVSPGLLRFGCHSAR